MKRFYKQVEVTSDLGIALDNRPVKTPKKAALALPSPALAEAVATEWRAQGEKVDPRTMPFTGLANAAIDVVGSDRAAFLDSLNPYAETDALCYRSDTSPDLAARQEVEWEPLLNWARARFDVSFVVTAGIIHVAQPAQTIARLQAALAAYDAFALAALSHLITISGSLVSALAVVEGRISAEAAFDATHLDELWQAELWGEDWMATDIRAARKADFVVAANFVALASPSTRA